MTVYTFVRKDDHDDVVFANDINELQVAIEDISAGGGGGGGMSGFTVAADSGTPQSITDGNTLTIVGGTGIDSVASATDTVTLNIDSTVATLTGSQTLTNKTLTSPAISSPTGLAKGDVGLGNVDNTSDATKNAAAVTLTNKTLTTPTIGSMTNANHNHTNSAGGGQLTDAALSSAVGIAKGGTGQTTAQNARNALLPTQANNKFLRSDGTDVTFQYAPISAFFAWKAGRYYSLQQFVGGSWANTFGLTVNQIYAVPLFVPEGSGAIDRVQIAVQTGIASSVARLMYFAPGTDGHPGALLFDWGTVSTATSGDKEITVASTLPPGPGFLACVSGHGITCYSLDAVDIAINGNTNGAGDDACINRANGGTTAPNPFGTTSLSYAVDRYPRLAVRAA